MPDLTSVFTELRKLLAPHAATLDPRKDTDAELYVNTRYMQKNKTTLFFGAVQIKKSYVSYHLMPVYVTPDLLDGISPELQARMQGKSCFNFTRVETELFKELGMLTKAGYASYKTQGFVP